MDDLLKDFLTETNEHLDAVGTQLVLFEQDPSDAHIIGNIFRLLHTIKGTCGFLGLPRLQAIAHAAEALIGLMRDGAPASAARVSLTLAAIDRVRFILAELDASGAEPEGDDADLIAELDAEAMRGSTPEEIQLIEAEREAPSIEAALPPPRVSAQAEQAPVVDAAASPPARGSSTIRVAVGSLERIMTLVSELVLTRNQLLELTRNDEDTILKPPLQRLSNLTSDLQDSVMRARMQPISRLYANLPRLVRDLANATGKKIELVTHGADTELDRQLIERVRDPLTHLIRNSADHGIEAPHERRVLGKRETGLIRISATHEAGYISIEISDDGRGLDVARIRSKALANGLATQAELERMTDDQACRFIFAPGFSTAQQVTSVSGRGIGMDVVRENVESIGGTISLATVANAGAVFTLKIPLTLAIAPALIVEASGHRFAIPQHAVMEALRAGRDGIPMEAVRHGLALRLRDGAVPLIDLRAMLGIGKPVDPAADNLVVVMRIGTSTFGVIVDSVFDVQEIVVKPLATSLSDIPIYAGNTILGDGSIVLILDPAGLAATLGYEVTGQFRVTAADRITRPPVETTRLLLFRGEDESGKTGILQALPLSVVARIETTTRDQIATSNGDMVMMYLGKLMPVVIPGATIPKLGETCSVLVIGVGGEPMGILVSEIVDIVDAQLDIQIATARPGVVGVTSLNGEAVEILDAAHFMRVARPSAFSRGHARRFRLLLVDDKMFFRDMLAPIVMAAGYEVCTAGSAREALALFAKGIAFDAVLTDIDMPEINGYDFARTLLEEPRRRTLPVLALDAHASPAVVEAAKAAGMRGAIGKFDRATLLQWLAKELDSSAFNTNDLERSASARAAA